MWCYRRAHAFIYAQFLANSLLNLLRRRAFYYRRARRFGC